MKRMIDNDLIATDNGTVQIGKDLEVDGKIHVNQASDIIDKDGKPIAGGGGVEWKAYSALVPENKILMYEIHVSQGSDGLEGWIYLCQLTLSYYGVPVSARGGTACGTVSIGFNKPQGETLWTVYPTSGFIVDGTTISQIPTANITCTITRVLVNE